MLYEECAVFLPFHVTVSKFAKMLVNLQLVLNSVLDSSGLSSDIVIFSGITAADAKAQVYFCQCQGALVRFYWRG